MNEDIFNLDDVSDLPKDIVEDIIRFRKKKHATKSDFFISLLKEAGRPLVISEIVVALYRLYKIKSNRKSIYMMIYAINNKNPSLIKKHKSQGNLTQYSI